MLRPPTHEQSNYRECNIVITSVLKEIARDSVPNRLLVGHEELNHPHLASALADTLQEADTAQAATHICLILPAKDGYIVRSDIFAIRFARCPVIFRALDCTEPRQRLQRVADDANITRIFASTAAILSLKDARNAPALDSILDAEIEMRLSFPWILDQQPRQTTLALFNGVDTFERGEAIYNAAKALGISLIVIDRPGHWIMGKSFEHLRQAFLPIDITPDPGLPGRIVTAIQDHGVPVDGLISYADPFLPYIALAAQQLGLPTPPPDALFISTDKHKTRQAENHEALRVSSPEEALKAVAASKLSYPLIVKPCCGFSSEGVSRVRDAEELTQAAQPLDTRRHGSDFVIEEYVDGPEVDANLVLLDDEELFWEVSDDFPSPGDNPGGDGGVGSSFIELANVLPSGLPRAELDMLRDSLHASLRRIGFRSGFFHMEARVRDSSMHYDVDDSGVLELREKGPAGAPSQCGTGKPSAFLVEINVRPPGIQASFASACTYGVEFYGLHLLFAVGDADRLRALTQPFAPSSLLTPSLSGGIKGAQHWCEIVFVPTERGGVYDGDEDCCEELKRRRPDLAAHIAKSLCFWKRGDEIPDPSTGVLTWIAYLLVVSRESRDAVVKLAEEVRSELRYRVV